jgi:hypothetical protein
MFAANRGNDALGARSFPEPLLDLSSACPCPDDDCRDITKLLLAETQAATAAGSVEARSEAGKGPLFDRGTLPAALMVKSALAISGIVAL